jgi:hypothetical protein
MGDTWVIDMSHFDYPEEDAYKFSKAALKLWAYFGSIVEGTVDRPPLRRTAGIRCRRRPKRVPCTGVIESELHPNGNELRWWCPVCGDNGLISNWEGTRWDPARKYRSIPGINFTKLFERDTSEDSVEKEIYEQIQGTIEWDEVNHGMLPMIVTDERQWSWLELGRELMTYEGFRIKIEIT